MGNKIAKFVAEMFMWAFIVCLFSGIWSSEFLWRLIFTGIVCFIFAVAIFKEADKK